MEQTASDIAIRKEAFQWLESQVRIHGEVLPRPVLQQGFDFEGKQIRLVGPQGIFKPRHMEFPISITTVPSGPYNDEIGYAGLLSYRYRGTDPNHRDNVGLRQAWKIGAPLIYFHGILPGKYLAAWPVFIVSDNPSQLTFSVAVDENKTKVVSIFSGVHEGYQQQPEDVFRRSYATREFRQRLHQSSFRERVGPIGINVPCAGFDTGNYLMPHTSCQMRNLEGNRWFQTAFHCANYTMLLLIDILWV